MQHPCAAQTPYQALPLDGNALNSRGAYLTYVLAMLIANLLSSSCGLLFITVAD